MLDSDYINLTEASKLAGLKDYSSLYRAARTGRLKTVTMAAWLQEYQDGQRRAT